MAPENGSQGPFSRKAPRPPNDAGPCTSRRTLGYQVCGIQAPRGTEGRADHIGVASRGRFGRGSQSAVRCGVDIPSLTTPEVMRPN